MGIYRRHLGSAFDQAPPAVRRFHELQGTHRLQGRVDVQGPQSALGRALALLFRLPRTGRDQPLSFELVADEQAETWTRFFPGRRMRSRLSIEGAYLVEDFGPVRLWFQLTADAAQLEMHLRKLTFFGIAMPRWLRPTARAVESGTADRIHFDVSASFPKDRLMVAYKGHLVLPEA